MIGNEILMSYAKQLKTACAISLHSHSRFSQANCSQFAFTMRGISLDEIWYQILVPELGTDLMFKGPAEYDAKHKPR